MHTMQEILAIERGVLESWIRQIPSFKVTAEDLRSEKAQTDLVPGRKSVGDVAVIPLSGFITQKPSIFSVLFGGTSADLFAEEVVQALRDSTVGAVVMHVDSPGGSVFGIDEAASRIRAARGSKPLVAVANPLAASAAYYLGSQADQVVATPSGIVGSIGVIGMHVDWSKALSDAGVKVTLLTYGERKADGNPYQELSDEARDNWQERVDYYGKAFEAAVAKGRNVSIETVRGQYGRGAAYPAGKAKAVGLVDSVATLSETIASLAKGAKPQPRAYDPSEARARAAVAGIDWPAEPVAE